MRKPCWIRLTLFAFCAGLAQVVLADTIAVIGTGNVGSALGQRFAEAGHVVVFGSRNPDSPSVRELVATSGPNASATTQRDAAQAADIVVLAVPWDVVETLTVALGDLADKIVIDPTNPRRITEDGLRDYAFSDSNAERIQTLAPDAWVVKAFSTLGAATMLNPAGAGGPVSIPIAGDDANAKGVVARLVTDIGLEPVDVGPLRYAHVIEGLHYLRYNAGQFDDARINFYMPTDPLD